MRVALSLWEEREGGEEGEGWGDGEGWGLLVVLLPQGCGDPREAHGCDHEGRHELHKHGQEGMCEKEPQERWR